MFVTYKNSKVTGYTKVYKYGETNGGGRYVSPQGGGYGLGPCGEDCSFDNGYTPEDVRSTGVEDDTYSYGYCGSSRSYKCDRQGHCAVDTSGGAGVSIIQGPYVTYTSSAKLFPKQTCLDGLTSTQTESETPYTKTAEQACVTSKNSGKDVPFAGKFFTTTLDCAWAIPSGALSLYANGPNFPAVLDTDKTTTYCAQFHENGECIDERDCTGVAVMPTYYDGCGKPDARFGDCLAIYKTVGDPCPIYSDAGCESAYILSKPGNYIAGGKNVGPFSTTTVHALSTDKAIEFNIATGKESPKLNQTFSYNNNEITYNELQGKQSTYTNSYIFFGESGASTTTYELGAGGYEAGADPVTLFYSEEVKATSEGGFWMTTGPGANPCCEGTSCETGEVSQATTDTVFGGSSFLFTYSKISTIQLGNYVAYQATSVSRKDHIAWGELCYSTSEGGAYNSNWQEKAEFGCGSRYLVAQGGGDMLYDCCVGGNVPRQVGGQTSVGKSKCFDLNCGCTSAKAADTTAREGAEPKQTQCFDPCASWFFQGEPPEECVKPYISPGGETCCPKKFFPHQVISEKQLTQEINRQGECAIVNKMSLDVAYTHFTRAQTLTTRIGFQEGGQDGGFQVTLQKSEGLYYLDSKGSMQTATSFSLKQSKSDIALSHVNFAFSGAYYNPMGKTTQFGSDGAQKTFIALATGDAVYLVGSPDGKSKAGTATASHDGDVHSYYISDPDAKSVWNQASWPGHGVVNGKITTGTFSFSFNTGAFANSYGNNGSLARFLPGANQTIVAHGGLNIISSKGNVSEKSFQTTYSTNAFSTSFDSSYKGAWIAKAIPYTYVSTKSVNFSPNPYLDMETSHIISISCPGCDFPQPAIPIPLIGDTSEYFIKGDKKLLYNNNATSYLWTHPAFKKLWGVGHGAECYEEE